MPPSRRPLCLRFTYRAGYARDHVATTHAGLCDVIFEGISPQPHVIERPYQAGVAFAEYCRETLIGPMPLSCTVEAEEANGKRRVIGTLTFRKGEWEWHSDLPSAEILSVPLSMYFSEQELEEMPEEPTPLPAAESGILRFHYEGAYETFSRRMAGEDDPSLNPLILRVSGDSRMPADLLNPQQAGAVFANLCLEKYPDAFPIRCEVGADMPNGDRRLLGNLLPVVEQNAWQWQPAPEPAPTEAEAEPQPATPSRFFAPLPWRVAFTPDGNLCVADADGLIIATLQDHPKREGNLRLLSRAGALCELLREHVVSTPPERRGGDLIEMSIKTVTSIYGKGLC